MRYVLTGPSSSGKSSLIEALAAQGVATMPEAGRPLVEAALAGTGGALPWVDPVGFRDMAFWRSIVAFDSCGAAKAPVLFDRSFVEATAHTDQAPLTPKMRQALQHRRFCNPVFVCPPWQEIYVTDEARPKSWTEAQSEWARESQAYLTAGYWLCALPKTDLSHRVDWFLEVLETL